MTLPNCQKEFLFLRVVIFRLLKTGSCTVVLRQKKFVHKIIGDKRDSSHPGLGLQVSPSPPKQIWQVLKIFVVVFIWNGPLELGRRSKKRFSYSCLYRCTSVNSIKLVILETIPTEFQPIVPMFQPKIPHFGPASLALWVLSLQALSS